MFEVFSFDFDGCLACIRFLAQTNKDILEANTALLDILKQSSNAKLILIGSNRQDLVDDLRNSFADERGSCFPAIKLVAEALNAQLVPLLLSDVYNNLPLGTSFNLAQEYIAPHSNAYTIKQIKEINPRYNWIHDESKLTLIYAQLQLLSFVIPDQNYHFTFFDDREDLLQPLHAYFSAYPQLIPKGAQLHLKQYKGATDENNQAYKELIYSFVPIQGTGEIDFNFAQTIKHMAAITIEQSDVTSSKSGRRITSYPEAQKAAFDLSAINVIKHYQPGMQPKCAPEGTSISSFDYAQQAKSILLNRSRTIRITPAPCNEPSTPTASPSYSWHSASSSMASSSTLSTSPGSYASSSTTSSPRSMKLAWQPGSKLYPLPIPAAHERHAIESPFALALSSPTVKTRSREANQSLIARPYLFFPATIPETHRRTTQLIGNHRLTDDKDEMADLLKSLLI